jgi:hypothetical protein
MTDLEKRAASKARRKRLAKGAALAGALAGALCHFVPPDYQAACAAVAKAASLSMGGC